MMNKHYNVIPNVGIKNNLTGEIYTNNRSICKELNMISQKSNELAEELYEFKLLLKKYDIKDVEKLDQILFNQVVW